MKRLITVALGVFAALAIPVLASAQVAHSEMATKKADLHVTQPLIVGTQTLPAGEYRYQCITINGETFLVITSDEGKEVVRVPCTPEPLAKKAELSDIRTTTRDGQLYLTAVRIKGEMVMHRLVPTPGA
jgi:hypothetical protein